MFLRKDGPLLQKGTFLLSKYGQPIQVTRNENGRHATIAQPPNMYQTLLLAGAITLIILWLSLKLFAKRKVQNLHTQYVFITGCGSGFGRETAIRLDKMGVHVLAACLTKQSAQDLKSTTSGKLKTFQMDVTDSQQIKDVFEQVKNLLPSGQGKGNCCPRRPHKMTRIICRNNSALFRRLMIQLKADFH